MFADVITVFNSYEDSFKNVTWYPTVVHGVNLLIDKAAIAQKNNFESNDSAVLNIHYQTINGQIMIDGKPYMPPKDWKNQTNDKLPHSITFTSGKDFDFFMLGEYPTTEPIADEDFDNEGGFYNYMNDNYDYVFAITSVAKYTAIPHFEIMGA